MSSDDEQHTFETADAGSSHTIPMQAGALKKGGHAMLKDHPCKVVDISTSKTGKHGHAKANITGIDIFTGKKYEDCHPTSHNLEVPTVTRSEYQLLNVEDSGNVSLLMDSGDTKDDLDLPKDNDGNDDECAKRVKELFNAGKTVLISVLSACGSEKIIEAKELNV